MVKGQPMALLPLLLLLLTFRGATPKSDGAPNSVCDSMMPHHRGLAPQKSPSPYIVSPSAMHVAAGDRINVLIYSPSKLPFHGFMLQARSSDGAGAVGSFTKFPDTAKAIPCNGIYASAVTHVSPTQKTNLTFEWTAPNDEVKTVIFNATVVQDFNTFWVGILSNPVKILNRSEVNPDLSTGISTTHPPQHFTSDEKFESSTTPVLPKEEIEKIVDPLNPIYDGCRKTKACFGDPENCIDRKDCKIFASVLVKGAKVYEFELFAAVSRYVAVGLSDDASMGDDSVVECVAGRDKVDAFKSWNTGKKNKRENRPFEGITLLNGTYKDGNIYCKFNRDEVTTAGPEGRTYDLSQDKYFLLLVSGSNANDSNVFFHDVNYIKSATSNSVTDVNGWDPASKLMIRLHGAFMIGAWIGTASLGILLARYFKQTWVGTQLCGKDLWFSWHRMFMLTTWSLTIAGFVIIFLELREWSQEDNPHAILGVVTTFLAFIQPIGAAFRPHPGARRRPIFNWLHWLVGNMAHILAIVTIFFAVRLSKAELPYWLDWVLVAYVTFHVILHLMLSIAGCVSERQNSSRINSFPMKDIASSRSPLQSSDRKQDAPLSCFRKVILGLYIFGILIITVAIILIVVFAPIEESFLRFQNMVNKS